VVVLDDGRTVLFCGTARVSANVYTFDETVFVIVCRSERCHLADVVHCATTGTSRHKRSSRAHLTHAARIVRSGEPCCWVSTAVFNVCSLAQVFVRPPTVTAPSSFDIAGATTDCSIAWQAVVFKI
jgi:hypothetical protein